MKKRKTDARSSAYTKVFPTTSLTVELKQEHIDKGVCGNKKECALARAAKSSLMLAKSVEDVEVGRARTKMYTRDNEVWIYSTPYGFYNRLKRFDEGDRSAITPGEVKFEPLRHCKYSAGQKERKRLLDKKRYIEGKLNHVGFKPAPASRCVIVND